METRNRKATPTTTDTATADAIEAAAFKAFEKYMESNAFVNAVEKAVERAIDKHIMKFNQRLDQLEISSTHTMEEIERVDGKALELESSLNTKGAEIDRLKDVIEKQSTSIHNLTLAMNEADQYSRRNCLKFYGVKESNTEITDDVICQLASERLGVNLTAVDIDRSHRVAPRGGIANDAGSADANPKNKRPRAIIAKFCSYRVRSAVLRARRKLKGTGMAIDEALTSTNQDLLWAAKKHHRVNEAWSFDGRIIVLLPATNGKTVKRTIHSKRDLDKL